MDLRDGESRSLVLVEPPGWAARAVLLDSRGRPVPFAAATVDPRAPVRYLRVERGVQDLALFTDRHGAIELPRMHHGAAEIVFRYGSRRASATLDEHGGVAVVRLPPPG